MGIREMRMRLTVFCLILAAWALIANATPSGLQANDVDCNKLDCAKIRQRRGWDWLKNLGANIKANANKWKENLKQFRENVKTKLKKTGCAIACKLYEKKKIKSPGKCQCSK